MGYNWAHNMDGTRDEHVQVKKFFIIHLNIRIQFHTVTWQLKILDRGGLSVLLSFSSRTVKHGKDEIFQRWIHLWFVLFFLLRLTNNLLLLSSVCLFFFFSLKENYALHFYMYKFQSKDAKNHAILLQNILIESP